MLKNATENYTKVYLSYKMHLVTAASFYIKIVRFIFISNINLINKRKVRNSSERTIGQVWEQLLGQLQRCELSE